MDDPIYTNDFIKKIIEHKKNEIVGLATAKGERLTIPKKRSKLMYIFSLLLIMGVWNFTKNSLKTIWFKLRKKTFRFIPFLRNPSILEFAKENGIKTFNIKSPNNKEFRQILKRLNIDVIINQSQSIIKSKLLNIPKIGIINRHNALLPKNRGRLTPFWVLVKKEKETGVSIHFVEENIDSGDIIVQEKFPILKKYNFNRLVKKNYEVAPIAMLKALDILAQGEYELIKNDDSKATYNTIPTFKEALKFRIDRILRIK